MEYKAIAESALELFPGYRNLDTQYIHVRSGALSPDQRWMLKFYGLEMESRAPAHLGGTLLHFSRCDRQAHLVRMPVVREILSNEDLNTLGITGARWLRCYPKPTKK